MLPVEEILELQTELGVPVKNLRLLNGHFLVEKIRMPDKHGELFLPQTYTKKSVGNLVQIKARVIRVSEPFSRKRGTLGALEFDPYSKTYRRKPIVKSTVPVVSEIQVGDGILYNSYNVGLIQVAGLQDKLAITREIDIEAVFQIEDADLIQLGDLALRGAATV